MLVLECMLPDQWVLIITNMELFRMTESLVDSKFNEVIEVGGFFYSARQCIG